MRDHTFVSETVVGGKHFIVYTFVQGHPVNLAFSNYMRYQTLLIFMIPTLIGLRWFLFW